MPCPYEEIGGRASMHRGPGCNGGTWGTHRGAGGRFVALLGRGSEKTQDNAGRNPIVVLMHVGAKGRSVIIHIEQTDLEAAC
jgi:hypothetical protein